MSNISVYHSSALSGESAVTATGVADGSHEAFSHDDRLSFSFNSAGSAAAWAINQPTGDVRPYQFLAICNHTSLIGGEARVFYSSDAGHSDPTCVISGAITSADPCILDAIAGVERTSDQYIEIEIEGPTPGETWSLGEVLLSPKFDSPVFPGVGIQTDYLGRSTRVSLPNGEIQTVKHAEPARRKHYKIGGLSVSQAEEWAQVFTNSGGAELCVLSDDRGDEYVCILQAELTVDDQALVCTIDLTFEEIAL